METIVRSFEDVDFKCFSLSYNKSYNRVFLNYDGKKLILTFKNVKSPFGIGDYNGNENYQMLIYLNEKTELFFKKLENTYLTLVEDLLEVNKDFAKQNKHLMKLKQKKLLKDEDSYYSLIKKNKNTKYTNNFKVKVYKHKETDGFNFDLYNQDKKEVEYDIKDTITLFKKRPEFSIALNINTFFMPKGKFGLTLVPKQIKYKNIIEDINDILDLDTNDNIKTTIVDGNSMVMNLSNLSLTPNSEKND